MRDRSGASTSSLATTAMRPLIPVRSQNTRYSGTIAKPNPNITTQTKAACISTDRCETRLLICWFSSMASSALTQTHGNEKRPIHDACEQKQPPYRAANGCPLRVSRCRRQLPNPPPSTNHGGNREAVIRRRRRERPLEPLGTFPDLIGCLFAAADTFDDNVHEQQL